MKITILGCGPSYGMPSLFRGYGECDPNTPENNRTRSAMLLEKDGVTILFDSGPEIRLQLLRAGVKQIDAIVYTHNHYDHMGGADDLRALLQNDEHGTIPVYGLQRDLESFKHSLKYLFQHTENAEHFVLNNIKPFTPFDIKGIKITPILQYHGETTSVGYRVDDFAYSTDVKRLDQNGFDTLAGIKTWVLGVVTPRENKKHISLPEAIQWIEKINPEHVILTHMGSKMDYNTLCNTLPPHIRPAYDGMVIYT